MFIHLRTRRLLLVVAILAAVQLMHAQTINQGVQTPPIQLGTSGGNADDAVVNCCSGTLGALVTDTSTSSDYILSAMHVIGRANFGATSGEAIIQPGLVDTGCFLTNVNYVATFTAGSASGSNVDAAIAQIVPGMVDTQGTILGVGVPAATPATPAVHEAVAKSGRTTGLTCDSITSVSTTVTVQYATYCGSTTTNSITYTNQIVINSPKFSASGDSGSLIVDANTAQPVGLLFAGSSTTTVANPIQDVLAQFPGMQMVGGETHAVTCPPNGNGKKSRTPVSAGAVTRAKAVKEKNAQALMLDPAVMAVGVGMSDDTPEPLVVIYVEEGRAHGAIPQVLDGVRTKVIQTDRIRAHGWNEPQTGACRTTKN